MQGDSFGRRGKVAEWKQGGTEEQTNLSCYMSGPPTVRLSPASPSSLPSFQPLTVAVPGTCGELIQGWHPDWEEPVLVSCPVSLYSRVTVRVDDGAHLQLPPPPSRYSKLRRAIRLVLGHLNHPNLGAEVRICSQLIPGRGMASSTADIVGGMAALGLSLNQPLTPAELAQLACRIEPSDSTMFSGLASLAYRGSGRYEELGAPPSLSLLVLDTEQVVDTLSYNARLDLAAIQRLAGTTRVALEWLREGIQRHNPAAIGAAATLSAMSYQSISYQPLLSQAESWAAATGALGIVRAHSGSLVGLLYEPGVDLAEPACWVAGRFDGLIFQTHLIGGGCSLVG